MKDKSKKILKGLGVGAMACVGAVALAGCSNVEVSQDKVDNVIETVEKSNQYMDSQLELLREQNAKLEAQLEELIEQNENLSSSDVDEIITQLKDSNENMLSQIEVLEAQNSFLESQLAELIEQNENLSGSDVDEIIEQLQASNENMATQIELLEAQNANLEAQLQQIIAESKKMTKEEAMNFAKKADYKLMMNVEGVRDNMVYTVGDPSGDFSSFKCSYYNANNIKAKLNEEVDEIWVSYQLGNDSIVSSSIEMDGEEYFSNEVHVANNSSINFESFVGIYNGDIPSLASLSLTENDLVYHEVLANGNLKLVFSRNVVEQSSLDEENYAELLQTFEYEYSKDGKILSLLGKSVLIDTDGALDEDEYDQFEMKITVEYGVVDVDHITNLIEVSENRRKALELVHKVDANLIANQDGIRDNLATLSYDVTTETLIHANLFYNNDNFEVAAETENDYLKVIYQKQGDDVVVNASVAVSPELMFTYISHEEELGDINDSELLYMLPTMSVIGLTDSDCKKVEILENRNYKLYYEKTELNYDSNDKCEEIVNCYTGEYSQDGKILNVTWNTKLKSRSEGFDMNETEFFEILVRTEVKYDVVTPEMINNLIAIIEAKRS